MAICQPEQVASWGDKKKLTLKFEFLLYLVEEIEILFRFLLRA